MSLVVTSTGGVDLSTVSSADITTRLPSGQTATWAWTVSGPTQSKVALTYAFSASGSETPEVGSYTFSGWVVTPTARRRIKPVSVTFGGYP